MRVLCRAIHPNIEEMDKATITQRLATRAIVIRGSIILMLYTQRYDDYVLPGGGLNDGEDIREGMIRELEEETGALNIVDIEDFGIYEEYRPWYKDDFDLQHIISYCFTCSINASLGSTRFEKNEIENGMKPVWIEIDEAIEHNERTIKSSKSKGMSVERETFLLHLIKKEKVGSYF